MGLFFWKTYWFRKLKKKKDLCGKIKETHLTPMGTKRDKEKNQNFKIILVADCRDNGLALP